MRDRRISLRSLGQRGFSMVEMTIAAAVMIPVMMAILQLMVSTRSQLRLIQQKQEVVELKNSLLQQLSQPAVCAFHLATPSITISVDGALSPTNPSPSVVNLPALHFGVGATAPVIARSGEYLPSTQTGLMIKNIAFKNIYPTGNPDEYRGVFEVQFDPISTVIPLSPAQVQVIVRTVAADPVTGKHISSCSSSMISGSTSWFKFCDTYRSNSMGCATPTADGQCRIPNSENALGCFLTGVDDDSGRVGFVGPRAFPIGTVYGGRIYNSLDVDLDDSGIPIGGTVQKCEVAPDPSGNGWYYRAWFDCQLVTCSYACIFR